MKKFVILFLLLITFNINAQDINEPNQIEDQLVVIREEVKANVETFAIDITDPEISISTLPIVSEKEIRCMQENLYHEARGEGERGMRAVAKVTLNRTIDPRYPDTVCGVVQEKTYVKKKGRWVCQFSWFCDKKVKSRGIIDIVAWEEAGRIARMAFEGTLQSIVGNATHYHATYVHPRWAKKIRRVARIGTHIFYREN